MNKEKMITEPSLGHLAEKAGHAWYKALKLENVNLGTSRFMITPIGKYINKYNMTISNELAEYELFKNQVFTPERL